MKTASDFRENLKRGAPSAIVAVALAGGAALVAAGVIANSYRAKLVPKQRFQCGSAWRSICSYLLAMTKGRGRYWPGR
jgi:hypothetical protein